jgi:hypothetical protein
MHHNLIRQAAASISTSGVGQFLQDALNMLLEVPVLTFRSPIYAGTFSVHSVVEHLLRNEFPDGKLNELLAEVALESGLARGSQQLLLEVVLFLLSLPAEAQLRSSSIVKFSEFHAAHVQSTSSPLSDVSKALDAADHEAIMATPIDGRVPARHAAFSLLRLMELESRPSSRSQDELLGVELRSNCFALLIKIIERCGRPFLASSTLASDFSSQTCLHMLACSLALLGHYMRAFAAMRPAKMESFSLPPGVTVKVVCETFETYLNLPLSADTSTSRVVIALRAVCQDSLLNYFDTFFPRAVDKLRALVRIHVLAKGPSTPLPAASTLVKPLKQVLSRVAVASAQDSLVRDLIDVTEILDEVFLLSDAASASDAGGGEAASVLFQKSSFILQLTADVLFALVWFLLKSHEDKMASAGQDKRAEEMAAPAIPAALESLFLRFNRRFLEVACLQLAYIRRVASQESADHRASLDLLTTHCLVGQSPFRRYLHSLFLVSCPTRACWSAHLLPALSLLLQQITFVAQQEEKNFRASATLTVTPTQLAKMLAGPLVADAAALAGARPSECLAFHHSFNLP